MTVRLCAFFLCSSVGAGGEVPGQLGGWSLSTDSTPSFSGHTGGPRVAWTGHLKGKRTGATRPVGQVKPQSQAKASQLREKGAIVTVCGLLDSLTKVGASSTWGERWGGLLFKVQALERGGQVSPPWTHTVRRRTAPATDVTQWKAGATEKREKNLVKFS